MPPAASVLRSQLISVQVFVYSDVQLRSDFLEQGIQTLSKQHQSLCSLHQWLPRHASVQTFQAVVHSWSRIKRHINFSPLLLQ